MGGVLIGFAIITSIVLLGYVVGRTGILGEHPRFALSRLTFFVLAPCLLFTVLADADVHALFSSMLAVSAIAALSSALVFALVARLVWKRAVPEIVIGSFSSSYVNAGNIGVPVAAYVLGDTAYAAPVILLQLLVLAPIGLTILGVLSAGKVSVGRVLLQPFLNPVIAASLAGVLLSIFEVRLPDAIMEPFRLVGGAAVPIVLISFGISLHGQRPLAAGSGRRDIILASGIKLAFMPLVAWLVGEFVFNLQGVQLFGVVMLASLPTAQNVLNYAQRYGRGEVIARDTGIITTVLAIPLLVVVAALLA
jgi:predicted permease